MKHLEVSGAVRPLYSSLGVKRLSKLKNWALKFHGKATFLRESMAPQFLNVGAAWR